MLLIRNITNVFLSFFFCLFQGSVTEEKASSSYVVVPIPTSLEEGRPSWSELNYLHHKSFQIAVFSHIFFSSFCRRVGTSFDEKRQASAAPLGVFSRQVCAEFSSVSSKKIINYHKNFFCKIKVFFSHWNSLPDMFVQVQSALTLDPFPSHHSATTPGSQPVRSKLLWRIHPHQRNPEKYFYNNDYFCCLILSILHATKMFEFYCYYLL